MCCMLANFVSCSMRVFGVEGGKATMLDCHCGGEASGPARLGLELMASATFGSRLDPENWHASGRNQKKIFNPEN